VAGAPLRSPSLRSSTTRGLAVPWVKVCTVGRRST
jgi:hypothetical protein